MKGTRDTCGANGLMRGIGSDPNSTREQPATTGESLTLSDVSAQLLLQGVTDYAIYILDPGGHIVSLNPGAERIKGYQANEVIGRHFSMFHTPEDLDARQPERELLAAAAGRFEGDGWRIHKDGTRFWANVVLTPLLDGTSQLRGFAKIVRDLTACHRANEERIRRVRAHEAIRLRDTFLTEARRQLQTTLVTLRVHLKTLQGTFDTLSRETPPGVRAKLTALEWTLNRLDRAVEDVRMIASSTTKRCARELDERG
jgi:PAS domain S-box-containing protein